MLKLKKVKSTKSEVKEASNTEVNLDQPRFLNKTMDELFWDAKGFKQCLWSYFVDIKKGTSLTEKDYQHCWEEFNRSEEFTMRMYSPKIEAMETKKESKVETITKASKEINALLNAPNLKKLKRFWKKISINEGDYTAEEFENLTAIKDKRKDALIKEKE